MYVKQSKGKTICQLTFPLFLFFFSSIYFVYGFQGKDVLVEKVVKVEIDTTETEIKSEPVENVDEKTDEPADLENSSTDGENERRCRKTLRLNSERLKQLNLRPGSNEVQFSVTTAFQGTTRCK